jgi:hypothetical protein
MSNIIRIPNIDKYRQEIVNNELILTPIKNYINEKHLTNMNLANSKIINCIITDNNDEIVSYSIKWFRIILDIYKSLSASTILQNTTFNIKLTNECGNKGYRWCPDINMSVQAKDANDTLKEILKMVSINKYKIDIEIKLFNEEIINFKK